MVAVAETSQQAAPEAGQRDRIAERSETLLARDIFQGRREVCIDFEGVQYRLRITRRNKLILQK